MAYRIDELKDSVDDEFERHQVGYSIYDVKEKGLITGPQLYGVIKALKDINTKVMQLDSDYLNFIVDEDGNEAIVPSVYNGYLKEHGCTVAYFADRPPLLLETRICEESKVGIVYYLYEDGINSETKTPFLNSDAIEIFNSKTPEEIEKLIKNEHKGKIRIKKFNKGGRK